MLHFISDLNLNKQLQFIAPTTNSISLVLGILNIAYTSLWFYYKVYSLLLCKHLFCNAFSRFALYSLLKRYTKNNNNTCDNIKTLVRNLTNLKMKEIGGGGTAVYAYVCNTSFDSYNKELSDHNFTSSCMRAFSLLTNTASFCRALKELISNTGQLLDLHISGGCETCSKLIELFIVQYVSLRFKRNNCMGKHWQYHTKNNASKLQYKQTKCFKNEAWSCR